MNSESPTSEQPQTKWPARRIIKYLLIGSAAGAAIGALIGYAVEGNAKGAEIGALIGGVPFLPP